jgi:3-dehydroquinate dehydratase-2
MTGSMGIGGRRGKERTGRGTEAAPPLRRWLAWTADRWTGTASYATRAAMSQTASPPLVAVLNGPNMNMLGLRQPHLYGSATLDDVEQLCAETADQLGLAIDFRQTNGEGELVSWVQECRGRAQGIVINPAGYTTTSIALMDALLASELPVIEVHITNIHRREEFRQHSYVSKAAVGVIAGLGVRGYALALTAMADLLLEAGA